MAAALEACRKQKMLAARRVWCLQAAREEQRAEWIESSTAAAEAAVALLRMRIAWRMWAPLCGRVPSAIRLHVAVLHALKGSMRLEFGYWCGYVRDKTDMRSVVQHGRKLN